MKIEKPVEVFYEFHKELEEQLVKLERSLNKFKFDGKTDEMRLALDGFYHFVKTGLGIHVLDEEHGLFPIMKSAKLMDEELEAFVDEHEVVAASIETLGLLKDMKDFSLMEVQTEVEKIIQTLREHKAKEEQLVLGQARENLTESQQRFLAGKMEKIRKDYEKKG